MTKAEQLIRRAEKALAVATPEVAQVLRLHIEALKLNPDNSGSQIVIRKFSALAEKRSRFFGNFPPRAF